jgi:hypothetical protein
MRVFVSHAHEQAAIADALAIALRQEHHSAFLDRDALRPGGDFHAAIREEIRRADLLVFLVSPQALEAGSYALTELAVAREAWPDPTSRVLPVLVTPTPFEAIPPWLKAVTVLQPQGDPVAETVARVAAMQAASDGRGRRRLGLAAVGVTAAALVAGVLWWRASGGEPAHPGPCLLEIAVSGPGAEGDVFRVTTLDVGLPGAPRAFLVAAGRASVDVGPLTGPDARWTIEPSTADGRRGATFQMQGCPDGPLELRDDGSKVLLRISPRG